MQLEVLKFLSCPVCKEGLRLHTIQKSKKRFETFDKISIETGILSCSCDFLFPIIESVPRMLIDSFIDGRWMVMFLNQVIVPLHKFISWVKGRKSRSWKEIMIELLDSFSPRDRFEHEPAGVSSWFTMNDFTDITTTTKNEFGFSIKGDQRRR
jgi:uncharacterized protein YbaR (Trm112 family)